MLTGKVFLAPERMIRVGQITGIVIGPSEPEPRHRLGGDRRRSGGKGFQISRFHISKVGAVIQGIDSRLLNCIRKGSDPKNALEGVCLFWPDRPDDGMIYFQGPDESRVWRCDYVSRKPRGPNFDS